MPDDAKLRREKLEGAATFDREPPVDDTFRPAPPRESILREIWGFMRVRKKFWLAPIILALLFLGALFFLASSTGVVAPFIYAL